MPTDQHQILISALKKALIEQKRLQIDYSTLEGDNSPPELNGHIPDIYGHDPITDLIVLGEAKTTDDIDSSNSKSQYLTFSSRVMSSGVLKGQSVPLHIIVPEDGELKLKNTLMSIGLEGKIGTTIIIWTL